MAPVSASRSHRKAPPPQGWGWGEPGWGEWKGMPCTATLPWGPGLCPPSCLCPQNWAAAVYGTGRSRGQLILPAQRRLVLPRGRPHSSVFIRFKPQREASGWLSLEMGKRHHPDVFLKWAWKVFQGRFVFASELLPDTDCIFWENARSWLMTEES